MLITEKDEGVEKTWGCLMKWWINGGGRSIGRRRKCWQWNDVVAHVTCLKKWRYAIKYLGALFNGEEIIQIWTQCMLNTVCVPFPPCFGLSVSLLMLAFDWRSCHQNNSFNSWWWVPLLHSHSISGYLPTLQTWLALQLTFSFWTPNWRQGKWQQTQCPFQRVYHRWWRAPLPQSYAHEFEECPLEGRQSQEYIIYVWNCKKIATMHVQLYRYISAPPLFHNCVCYKVFSLPVNTRDGLVRLMLPCSSSSPICCCLRPAYVYRLTAVVSKPDLLWCI